MAAFFDTRTVKSQGGLQAPAILSVQGRNYDVQVLLSHGSCTGSILSLQPSCSCTS